MENPHYVPLVAHSEMQVYTDPAVCRQQSKNYKIFETKDEAIEFIDYERNKSNNIYGVLGETYA